MCRIKLYTKLRFQKILTLKLSPIYLFHHMAYCQVVKWPISKITFKVLNRVDVSEIGRRHMVMSSGDDSFTIGMTLAFFHIVGTVACFIEVLKIDATVEISTWS